MLRGNLYSGFPIADDDETGNARTARRCLLSSSTPEVAQSMRSRAWHAANLFRSGMWMDLTRRNIGVRF